MVIRFAHPVFNSSATVPNPNVPNKLFKNNGDGTFTQVTGTVFDTDIFFAARTSSWGDIDNDGDLDLYRLTTCIRYRQALPE